MSQPIDLLIKNGSCFIDNNLKKVDLAISDSKIQEIGDLKKKMKNLTLLPSQYRQKLV